MISLQFCFSPPFLSPPPLCFWTCMLLQLRDFLQQKLRQNASVLPPLPPHASLPPPLLPVLQKRTDSRCISCFQKWPDLGFRAKGS